MLLPTSHVLDRPFQPIHGPQDSKTRRTHLRGTRHRDIEAIAGCSHRTIAKAKKVCHDQGLSAAIQIDALGAEEIDGLFADGRKRPSEEFI